MTLVPLLMAGESKEDPCVGVKCAALVDAARTGSILDIDDDVADLVARVDPGMGGNNVV